MIACGFENRSFKASRDAGVVISPESKSGRKEYENIWKVQLLEGISAVACLRGAVLLN